MEFAKGLLKQTLSVPAAASIKTLSFQSRDFKEPLA